MIFKPLEAAVSRNPSIVVPADTAATAAPAQGTDIPPEEGAGADGALIGPLGMITFVPWFIQEYQSGWKATDCSMVPSVCPATPPPN
jgi:hypothetical protein